uniref:Small ubiquitin-related modifier n=1 Tax=Pygocentrus nattereri TaxID=42514 RepID=A0AAR2IMR4_PYGNA
LSSDEGVKTENDHINLKVAGQDGSVVQFKIKRHTPLSKLMKAYCERQGLSIRQIRFRFDGQPINETDTPAQLEMEDEDTIDVFQQQTGGSPSMWSHLSVLICTLFVVLYYCIQ